MFWYLSLSKDHNLVSNPSRLWLDQLPVKSSYKNTLIELPLDNSRRWIDAPELLQVIKVYWDLYFLLSLSLLLKNVKCLMGFLRAIWRRESVFFGQVFYHILNHIHNQVSNNNCVCVAEEQQKPNSFPYRLFACIILSTNYIPRSSYYYIMLLLLYVYTYLHCLELCTNRFLF